MHRVAEIEFYLFLCCSMRFWLHHVASKNNVNQALVSVGTVFAQSDAAATIYFVHQFCVASIRERRLFENGVYFAQPIPSLT